LRNFAGWLRGFDLLHYRSLFYNSRRKISTRRDDDPGSKHHLERSGFRIAHAAFARVGTVGEVVKRLRNRLLVYPA